MCASANKPQNLKNWELDKILWRFSQGLHALHRITKFSLRQKSWYHYPSRSSRAITHQQQSPDLLRTTTGLRPSRLEGREPHFTTVKKSCVCATQLAALYGRLPRLLLISEPTLFPRVPAPLQWQAEDNQASRAAWQIALSSALRRPNSSSVCSVAVAPFEPILEQPLEANVQAEEFPLDPTATASTHRRQQSRGTTSKGPHTGSGGGGGSRLSWGHGGGRDEHRGR